MCRKECWNKCVSSCNVYNIIDQNLHPCMTRTRTYDHIHSNYYCHHVEYFVAWCVVRRTHNMHAATQCTQTLHTSCTKIWDGQMARVNKNHKTIKWFLPTLHRTFLSPSLSAACALVLAPCLPCSCTASFIDYRCRGGEERERARMTVASPINMNGVPKIVTLASAGRTRTNTWALTTAK